MDKRGRGFASMDKVKRSRIASMGGRTAHKRGTAHEWTTEEAREAGRKGGLTPHRRRRLLDEVGALATEFPSGAGEPPRL